jgi:hypothetical protein
MIPKIFDFFRRNSENPSKYVVNCNPSLRLQLPDAIALRRAVMRKFPESEAYGETFCFLIVSEDIDSFLQSVLKPTLLNSASELGLPLPIEFKVQPCLDCDHKSSWVVMNGLHAAESTASYIAET